MRQLRPGLEERTITDFTAFWPRVTAPAEPSAFTRQVVGRTILAVRRRGKYILLDLNRGLVHLHLRMTGRLQLRPQDEPIITAHLTAAFTLSGGPRPAKLGPTGGDGGGLRLEFRDMRKFGRIGYLASPDPLEVRLGPEPLSPDFTPPVFHGLLSRRRRQIKPLLLDQTFLAGLGNIYVDEALFKAGIHPLRAADRLTPEQAATLHGAIRDILAQSIARRGTTFINFGFGDGQSGAYRERLQVFGRAGEPCPVCRTPLEKTRVAQRGTYLCPSCQAA